MLLFACARYLARLRKTALGLPKKVVSKAVKDMKRRMLELKGVCGLHFES